MDLLFFEEDVRELVRDHRERNDPFLLWGLVATTSQGKFYEVLLESELDAAIESMVSAVYIVFGETIDAGSISPVHSLGACQNVVSYQNANGFAREQQKRGRRRLKISEALQTLVIEQPTSDLATQKTADETIELGREMAAKFYQQAKVINPSFTPGMLAASGLLLTRSVFSVAAQQTGDEAQKQDCLAACAAVDSFLESFSESFFKQG